MRYLQKSRDTMTHVRARTHTHTPFLHKIYVHTCYDHLRNIKYIKATPTLISIIFCVLTVLGKEQEVYLFNLLLSTYGIVL